ncbi:hypothetical protein E6O75_ATG03930 [Venturia nashicola]|uniref:Uncharacterized protein n=1 Tax=Venturia nashicola TaxID=86259 RepID=A0A4Z1P9X9_9PEZI|nr:hypothetical protein E6O75_ATG03930 [Venturia nashicola]
MRQLRFFLFSLQLQIFTLTDLASDAAIDVALSTLRWSHFADSIISPSVDHINNSNAYKSVTALQHHIATIMVVEKRFRNRIINAAIPLAEQVGQAHEVRNAVATIKQKAWVNNIYAGYVLGDTDYVIPKVSLN